MTGSTQYYVACNGSVTSSAGVLESIPAERGRMAGADDPFNDIMTEGGSDSTFLIQALVVAK